MFEEGKEWNPLVEQWDFNWNTFFQIILDSNLNLRLHIRRFKETKSGEFSPTGKRVLMVPTIRLNLLGKLSNFKFESVNDSFICSNQLLVVSVDSDFCLLQPIFPLNPLGFILKPSILKICREQMFKLKDILFEITETIPSTMLTVQIPKLILNESSVYFSHVSNQNGMFWNV